MIDHPLKAVMGELAKQATMRFEGRLVAKVQRTVGELARGHDISIVCPLPVWDNTSMGVKLSRVIPIKGKQYTQVSSFTLTERELEDDDAIKLKAETAVDAIVLMVLSQISPVKEKVPA